jgi:hypothetical protein
LSCAEIALPTRKQSTTARTTIIEDTVLAIAHSA